MIKLYEIDGFIIYVIMIEMGFDKVAEIMGNGEVKISEAREHVLEVKKMIGTVKDCGGGGIISKLPYSYLPSQIIIHLLYFILIWLN